MRTIRNKIALLILAGALALAGTGCSGQKSETSGEEVSQEQSDAWMDEENGTEQDFTLDGENSGDDYFDVAAVEDEDIDYSKYKEKTSRVTVGGSQTGAIAQGQDEYYTDPVPEGRQHPVEPENVEVDTTQELSCYLTISCAAILDNMGDLTEGKEDLVPSNGMIYKRHKVTFYEGESVFDVLKRVTRDNRIHMEFVNTPKYNSAYIEGINNLYEFDCGSGSGWMYCVNGWYPNYGCSRYAVQQGDEIEWNYTCDLGRDLGTTWMD